MYTLENKLEQSSLYAVVIKILRIGLITSNILVTCITFAAVIARAMNVNLLGYEEILIICAFWLYMIGSAYGSFEESHIKADIIVIMMKEGFTKDLIALLRNTLSVIIGIIFLFWALQLFQWNIINGQQTPVWRIPVTVSQSSLLFGLAVGTFFHLVHLYNEIKRFIYKWIKKVEFVDQLDDKEVD